MERWKCNENSVALVEPVLALVPLWRAQGHHGGIGSRGRMSVCEGFRYASRARCMDDKQWLMLSFRPRLVEGNVLMVDV